MTRRSSWIRPQRGRGVVRCGALPPTLASPRALPTYLCCNAHAVPAGSSFLALRQAPEASLARLAEALHRFYPAAVPMPLIWGYGRPLWDPSCRVHGRRPLKVVVLGPAGSGKSTQCELLARRRVARDLRDVPCHRLMVHALSCHSCAHLPR